jgi:hypothetical protein
VEEEAYAKKTKKEKKDERRLINTVLELFVFANNHSYYA